VESRLLECVGEIAALTEDPLEGLSELDSVSLSGSGKLVECVFAEVVVLGYREEGSIKKTLVLKLRQIDNSVTDSCATDSFVGRRVDKDTEGNILKRELSVGIVRDPRFEWGRRNHLEVLFVVKDIIN
jgi:hypothetical protein